MWYQFAADVFIAFTFLYLPGFLLLRSTNLPRLFAFAAAPLFSSLCYVVLGFVYGALGIGCSWFSVVLPVFSISAVILGLATLIRKKNQIRKCKVNPPASFDVRILAGYVCLAALIAGVFFVKTLDGAASFYQENDNVFHLTLVRDFLNTETYALSSLLSYPASWHVVTACVADVFTFDITIAVNAVNFVLIAITAPLSMLCLMVQIFPNDKKIVAWGALCSVGFAAYPWGFLLFGPLYPNLFGYVMVPAVMALFIGAVENSNKVRKLLWGSLFLIGCASLVFAHPNAIFVGIVILTPYCVSRITKLHHEAIRLKIPKANYLMAGSFVLAVLLIWATLYQLPMFAGVVSFNWPSYSSAFQGFINDLMISYTKASAPQYLLGAAVLVGLAYCMVGKRYRWLVVAYFILMGMHVVCISTEGFLKHFLTGFWYTDEFRIAAAMAIAGVPLASIGLRNISRMLGALTEAAIGRSFMAVESSRFMIVVGLVFVLVNYVPSFDVQKNDHVVTGFGSVEAMLQAGNSMAINIAPLDIEEAEFLEEVKSVVGNNKVLNFPYDGSAYAYALENLNVVNRTWFGYDSPESGTSLSLAHSELSSYTINEEVKAALGDLGVSYLMLLDQGREESSGKYDAAYEEEKWTGLISVLDNTPGFEIVLSEGDMRLYKLTDI